VVKESDDDEEDEEEKKRGVRTVLTKRNRDEGHQDHGVDIVVVQQQPRIIVEQFHVLFDENRIEGEAAATGRAKNHAQPCKVDFPIDANHIAKHDLGPQIQRRKRQKIDNSLLKDKK
jgi:hypothetical protein